MAAAEMIVTHRFARATIVRIRLCGAHCRLCQGGHRFTEPLEAERIGYRRVRVTADDPVWEGCEIGDSDYEVVK